MSFTLDPYAARTCPVKTQHRFTPGRTPGPVEESLQESFHGGRDHAAGVYAVLTSQTPGVVNLRALPRSERQEASAQAMADGAAVILGAVLAPDPMGHREGWVDVLVRGPGADRARYQPVLVKPRRFTELRQSGKERVFEVAVSDLRAPAHAEAHRVPDLAIRRRDHDLMQLAHLHRLLVAQDRAVAGVPRAGVIGTDHIAIPDAASDSPADAPDVGTTGRGPVVTWVDLDEPLLITFSRSAPTGRATRSALERYDHEFAFRVDIASNARAGGLPLVEPIRISECEACPWWTTCAPIMGESDLSIRIDTAPLDVREIRTLRGLGVRTVDDLAGRSVDDLLPDYLPEVTHRSRAESRLRNTARRARMIRDGVELERSTTGPIGVPRAAVEIDFDIETYDDRVYLWGFLVHDRRRPGAATYHAFTSWERLDDAAEIELARAAMGWLRDLVSGTDALVYHYSAYETMHLQQLAARGDVPEISWAEQWARQGFVDLYLPVRQHYFGCHGLGLKVVAQTGAGFHWRDPDPGGRNSLDWYEEATGGADPVARDAARTRLWEYNEDDVRATWHLRAWLAAAR